MHSKLFLSLIKFEYTAGYTCAAYPLKIQRTQGCMSFVGVRLLPTTVLLPGSYPPQLLCTWLGNRCKHQCPGCHQGIPHQLRTNKTQCRRSWLEMHLTPNPCAQEGEPSKLLSIYAHCGNQAIHSASMQQSHLTKNQSTRVCVISY